MRLSRALALTLVVGALLSLPSLLAAVERDTPSCAQVPGADARSAPAAFPILSEAPSLDFGLHPTPTAKEVCGAVAQCNNGMDVACIGYGTVGIDCFAIQGCYAYCSGTFAWCPDADRRTCPTP